MLTFAVLYFNLAMLLFSPWSWEMEEALYNLCNHSVLPAFTTKPQSKPPNHQSQPKKQTTICPRNQLIVVFIHQLGAPHFQASNSRCEPAIKQVFGQRLMLEEPAHTAHSNHLLQGTYHIWLNLALEVVDCCRLELSNSKSPGNRSCRIPRLKLQLAVSQKNLTHEKSGGFLAVENTDTWNICWWGPNTQHYYLKTEFGK